MNNLNKYYPSETVDTDTLELLVKETDWTISPEYELLTQTRNWLESSQLKAINCNERVLDKDTVYVGSNSREGRYNVERSKRLLVSCHKETASKLFDVMQSSGFPSFLQIHRLDLVMEIHSSELIVMIYADLMPLIVEPGSDCWYAGSKLTTDSPISSTDAIDPLKLTIYLFISPTKKLRVYFPDKYTTRVELEIRDSKFWQDLTKSLSPKPKANLLYMDTHLMLRQIYARYLKIGVPLMPIKSLQMKMSTLLSYLELGLEKYDGCRLALHPYASNHQWFFRNNLLPTFPNKLESKTGHTVGLTSLLKELLWLPYITHQIERSGSTSIPKSSFFALFGLQRIRKAELVQLLDQLLDYVLLISVERDHRFVVSKTQTQNVIGLFGEETSWVIRPLFMNYSIGTRAIELVLSPDFFSLERNGGFTPFPCCDWWRIRDDLSYYLYLLIFNEVYRQLLLKSNESMVPVLPQGVSVSLSPNDGITLLLDPSLGSSSRHRVVANCFALVDLLKVDVTTTIRCHSDGRSLKMISSFVDYLDSLKSVHCKTVVEVSMNLKSS